MNTEQSKQSGSEQRGEWEAYVKFPDVVLLRRPEDKSIKPQDFEYLNLEDLHTLRLERIEFSREGLLTYMEGHKLPYKGFPHDLYLRAVGVVKKWIPLGLEILIKAPYLIPFAYFARKHLINAFSRYSNRVLRDYYFKPVCYCVSGQEIYRTLMTIPAKDKDGEECKFNLVMLVVMLWQWDDGYRFPLQYVLGKLDKEALKRNTRKEIRRLLNLLIEGYKLPGIKKNLKLARKLTYFMPTKLIKEIFLELDTEKIKLDEADLYWAKDKHHFNYV